jgi:hypothetical protein
VTVLEKGANIGGTQDCIVTQSSPQLEEAVHAGGEGGEVPGFTAWRNGERAGKRGTDQDSALGAVSKVEKDPGH